MTNTANQSHPGTMEEWCCREARQLEMDVRLCWGAMRYVYETFCKDDKVFAVHVQEVEAVLNDCRQAFAALDASDDPFLSPEAREWKDAFKGIVQGLEEKITEFKKNPI